MYTQMKNNMRKQVEQLLSGKFEKGSYRLPLMCSFEFANVKIRGVREIVSHDEIKFNEKSLCLALAFKFNKPLYMFHYSDLWLDWLTVKSHSSEQIEFTPIQKELSVLLYDSYQFLLELKQSLAEFDTKISKYPMDDMKASFLFSQDELTEISSTTMLNAAEIISNPQSVELYVEGKNGIKSTLKADFSTPSSDYGTSCPVVGYFNSFWIFDKPLIPKFFYEHHTKDYEKDRLTAICISSDFEIENITDVTGIAEGDPLCSIPVSYVYIVDTEKFRKQDIEKDDRIIPVRLIERSAEQKADDEKDKKLTKEEIDQLLQAIKPDPDSDLDSMPDCKID